jgi:hypothetical protein
MGRYLYSALHPDSPTRYHWQRRRSYYYRYCRYAINSLGYTAPRRKLYRAEWRNGLFRLVYRFFSLFTEYE